MPWWVLEVDKAGVSVCICVCMCLFVCAHARAHACVRACVRACVSVRAGWVSVESDLTDTVRTLTGMRTRLLRTRPAPVWRMGNGKLGAASPCALSRRLVQSLPAICARLRTSHQASTYVGRRAVSDCEIDFWSPS